MRFLFYSHDGLGFGHTRRNLAIAAAIRDQSSEASILVATGVREAGRLGLPPRVELLQLPAIRKVANEAYAARNLRIAPEEIRALRSALMESTIRTFQPDVFLVDKHPLGVRGELIPALETLRETGGRAVLGLRPILDDPEAVRAEWAPYGLPERISHYFERVLVYGVRRVFDPTVWYAFPQSMAERTHFCGFVESHLDVTGRAEDRWDLSQVRGPIVLAAAGGGEDGRQLLETFVEASQDAPWQAVVVTGSMMPERDREALGRMADDAGARCYEFVTGLSRWFDQIDALVCMGGYNTLVEALSRAVPTVCVPRTEPRVEQLMRARAFARLGLLRLLEPRELDGWSLRRAIQATLIRSREGLRAQIADMLNFDGAGCAAAHLLELAGSRPSERPMHVSTTAGRLE